MGSRNDGIRAMWWEFIPFASSKDTALQLLTKRLRAEELASLVQPAGPMSNTVRTLSHMCIQQSLLSFEEVPNESYALEYHNESHTFVFPVTLPKCGSMLYKIPGMTFLPFMESPGVSNNYINTLSFFYKFLSFLYVT